MSTSVTSRIRRLPAFWAVALLVVLPFVLSACGADPTATPTTAAATPTPTEAGPSAPAATPTPEPTPTPDAAALFQVEWDALIAAAQAEGQLTIAAGGAPSREYRGVVQQFEDTFGVTTVMSTGSGSDTINRVLAERQAGQFLVDVGLISIITSDTRLIPGNVLEPIAQYFIHPDVTDESLWFGGRHWYGDAGEERIFIYSAGLDDTHPIFYNTNLMSADEVGAITSIPDMLADRWTGRYVGLTPDASAGLGGLQSAGSAPARRPPSPRQHAPGTGTAVTGDRRVLVDWLAMGAYPLVAFTGGVARDLRALEGFGAPVKEVFIPRDTPGLSAGGSGNPIEMFTQAPHPNAAKLFLNWWLSREGQTFIHENVEDLQRQSLRTDIPIGNVDETERRAEGAEYTFQDADPAVQPLKDEALIEIAKIWLEARP